MTAIENNDFPKLEESFINFSYSRWDPTFNPSQCVNTETGQHLNSKTLQSVFGIPSGENSGGVYIFSHRGRNLGINIVFKDTDLSKLTVWIMRRKIDDNGDPIMGEMELYGPCRIVKISSIGLGGRVIIRGTRGEEDIKPNRIFAEADADLLAEMQDY